MTEAVDLPSFIEDHTDHERYDVGLEARPHADGHRVRTVNRPGTPATAEALQLIRAANADGWRLDKHSDAGDELVFVPFDGGHTA
jgi:hypothetical protein